MSTATVVFAVLFVVFFGIALFLGKEMLKKFDMMAKFAEKSGKLVKFRYEGGRKPGMYNIVIRNNVPHNDSAWAKTQGSISALIGFDLKVPGIGRGFDYYAYAENPAGCLVIYTWLGQKPVEFYFLVNSDNPVVVTSTEVDQEFGCADVTCPPHWWQRFGFYA